MKKLPCNGHGSRVGCFQWGPFGIAKIRVIWRGLCARLIPKPPPTQISHFNGVIYGYSSREVVYFGLLIIKGIRVLGRQKREKSYLDFLRSLRSGRNSMGMVELPMDNFPAYWSYKDFEPSYGHIRCIV